MKKLMKFSSAVLVLASVFVSSSSLARSNNSFEAYVPKGHEVVKSIEADVNSDGLLDILLITQPATDKRANRLFQILNSTGKGYKVYQNTELIPCEKCGGPSEEPTLREITISRSAFSVKIYYGGIRNGFLKTFDFRYASKHRNWYLQRVDSEVFDRLKNEGKTQVQQKKYTAYRKDTRFEKVNKYR